jgi:hypothetical protein
MGRFTQYPAASTADYADATTFLIANEDGLIKQASLDGLMSNYGSDIRSASLVIASADVLQLNSTPQTIVAAQGAGKAIEVISASVKVDFNSAAYATNTTLQLICSGANENQASTALDASVSSTTRFRIIPPSSATDTQVIANAALQVSVETGDPTTGDSDIEVFVLYRIINV